MNALLLAAGYATRLYPLTRDTPKPLLPVAGRPIADYMVEQLAAIPEIERAAGGHQRPLRPPLPALGGRAAHPL